MNGEISPILASIPIPITHAYKSRGKIFQSGRQGINFFLVKKPGRYLGFLIAIEDLFHLKWSRFPRLILVDTKWFYVFPGTHLQIKSLSV